MSAVFQLERFDPQDDEADLNLAEIEQAAYERGFQDGIDATETARARSEQSSVEQINQTLNELEITFAEAHQSVVASLRGVFAAISDVVVPALCREMLLPKVTELLLQDPAMASAAHVTIALSHQDFERLSGQNALILPDRVSLRGDEALDPGQALIASDQSETALDHQRICNEIQDALALLRETPQENVQNG